MAITTYELSGVAHGADGQPQAGLEIAVQLVTLDERPTADYFPGVGEQLPILITTTSDSNGAWSVDIPSNLDGNQDLRYRVVTRDATSKQAIGRGGLIQMPRAAATFSALVDGTAVTPTPESAAAPEVAKARAWALTAEDTLVPASAGGNESDEYSSLHHSAKAAKRATTAQRQASADEDAEVVDAETGDGTGAFSAKHHAAKAAASSVSAGAAATTGDKRATTAARFASAAEDVEVVNAESDAGTGLFSALHHAAKAAASAISSAAGATAAALRATNASRFATAAEDVEVVDAETESGTGLFSALHHATKAAASNSAAALRAGYAQKWANEDEDVAVAIEAGGDGETTFSARHHAAKANADRAYIETELPDLLFVVGPGPNSTLQVATAPNGSFTEVTTSRGYAAIQITY